MGTAMQISGIGVRTSPGRCAAVSGELAKLPGVEVRHCDPATGRLVVVQELATVEEHMDGLRRIQALPGVLVAELVCHVAGDGGVGIPVGSEVTMEVGNG